MKNEFKVGDRVKRICDFNIWGDVFGNVVDGIVTHVDEYGNILVDNKDLNGNNYYSMTWDKNNFVLISSNPELENVFKKSDLRAGDVVVCRDGSRDKVITYCDSSDIRFAIWSIDLWNDDLTFHLNSETSRKNDIVSIERTQVFEINQVVKETLDIASAEKLLASLGHDVVIK